MTQFDGMESVLEMLRCMDTESQEKLLKKIAEENPEFAQHLRDNIFCFVDLMHLNDRSLQELLRAVKEDILSLALRGMKESFHVRILKNLSKRIAEEVLDSLKNGAPRSATEVQKAQSEILAIARGLEAKGKVSLQKLNRNDDDLV